MQGYEKDWDDLLRQQTSANLQSITDQGGSSHTPSSTPFSSIIYDDPYLSGAVAWDSANSMATVPRGQTSFPMIDPHTHLQADFQLWPSQEQPNIARLLTPNGLGVMPRRSSALADEPHSRSSQEPPSDCFQLDQARKPPSNLAYYQPPSTRSHAP